MDKGSAGNAIKIRRGPLGGKMRYVFFIEAYYKKNGQTNGNKHMSPRVEAQGLIPMEEFGTEKTR